MDVSLGVCVGTRGGRETERVGEEGSAAHGVKSSVFIYPFVTLELNEYLGFYIAHNPHMHGHLASIECYFPLPAK